MEFFHKINAYGVESNNSLIWGENYHVLKLLKNKYKNKIQCIYADPPYNTCQCFDGFNDSLSHRKWSRMMKKRLKLLWSFLSDTGFIWISIDDAEFGNLKLLCDKLWGKEKFVSTIVRQKNKFPSSHERPIVHMHDYILVYAKNSSKAKFNSKSLEKFMCIESINEEDSLNWRPANLLIRCSSLPKSSNQSEYIFSIDTPIHGKITPPKGKCWSVNCSEYRRLLQENKIWFDGNDPFPYIKYSFSENPILLPTTMWNSDLVDTNQAARMEIAKYNSNKFFYVPKPEKLISVILEMSTNPGDFVLDPFLGSGTTAVVAQKMGRQWIGIEKEEYQCNKICFERLKDTIDGNEESSINKILHWTGGGGFSFYKTK